MKTICYTLELKAPVLATEVGGEPNSAVSAPYISGALLRGALAARYLRQEPSFDAAGAVERALFLGTETRFLNAYPIKDDKRALLTPLAWRHNKDDGRDPEKDGREIHNQSYVPFDFFQSGTLPDQVPEESVKGQFTWIDGETARWFSPSRQLNIHTQRDARMGRATEEAGAIYRYDALAAGLQLQGIILTNDEQAARIEGLLNGATLTIGRARNAGYGEAVVTKIETLDYWREVEVGDSEGEITPDRPLQVTFTSDALLRDDCGQATLNPLPAIAARLEAPLESLTLLPGFTRAASGIVGGFNRKWGLPLPQTIAIAAGSVFTFRTSETLTVKALERLELEGIGERRAEGFGRLLVNWHLEGQYLAEKVEPSRRVQLNSLSPEESGLAEKIAERMLLRCLDEELRRRINYTKLERLPAKSQLSRLRVILRDIQTGRVDGHLTQTKRLKDYFEHQGGRSTGQPFKDVRVIDNGKPLMGEDGRIASFAEWVMSQIEKAEDNWKMEVKFGGTDAKVEKKVSPALAEEYALRLIDQVLYRTAKEME